MSRTRQLTAITMVAVVVLASGCAGFGTDGPADGDGEADADNGSGDLEGSDDTQDGQDDRPDGGDGASDGGADDGSDGGGDSDGAPSGSDSDSKSGSDADADTGSESKADDGTKDGNESKDSDSGGAMDGSSGDGDGDAGDENSGDGDGEGVSSDDDTDPSDSGDGDDDDRNGGDDEAPYGTLTVTVENDGEPVEGVEVVGIGPGGEIYSSVTDGNGRATFDLGDGAYTWYASTDGTEYDESSEEEITMDGEDRSIVLTVQSDEPGPTETHTLTVTVTDPDGEPVTDETVHIVTYDGGADVASGTTDENGTVQFDLENGDYEVAVSAPDQDLYQPSDQRLVTIDGEDEEFSVQLRSPDGDETHTLTVTIIDQTAAGPMDGTATVDGETKDVVGDEGAEFEVEDGTYAVTGEASTDGWHVGSEEVTIDGGDKEVSLPANPIRTVTVDTGEAGVDVTLVDENGDEVKTKTTDDDGRVEFDALPGTYSLHADGYESNGVTVPGAHDPETVEMSPETVTHTLTINNAGTSTVEIEREARPGGDDGEIITAEPDENGVVQVDVEEGTYHVRTDDRNDTMVGIHVDENTEITLQDPNADPITIEVVDADTGERIEGAEISGVCDMWYSSGDDYITGTTGPDGIAEAEPGLSPTNCDANINAEGYEEEVVQLSIPENDAITVELQPEDGMNDDPETCGDFSNHDEAQEHFEHDLDYWSGLDADNDGVACETRPGDAPAAYAIVIVEDQNGNRVAGQTVEIGDKTVQTNDNGVASTDYRDDDFGDNGQTTVDVAVLDEKTQMIVVSGEGREHSEEGTNIETVSVQAAVAQGSASAVAA